MPLYEYECESCGALFELIRKFSDPPLDKCRTCGGGPVRKLISSPAIQFKGSGFYINDYARQSSASEGGSKDGKDGKDTGGPATTESASKDAGKDTSKDSGKETSKDSRKDSTKEPAKTSAEKPAASAKAETKS